jgi:hypothetical protein
VRWIVTDVIAEGAAWLQEVREQAAGVPATYWRGQTSAFGVMTRGRSSISLDSGLGIIQQVESVDWIGPEAMFADFGDPKPGDRVVVTDGSRTWTYEVLHIPNGSCWRWAGDNVARRVYTKLTKVE